MLHHDASECSSPKSLYGVYKNIRNELVVMSGKGGVGKSTVAGLLAAAWLARGIVGYDCRQTGPSQPKISSCRGTA
jgi:Mrp family chromosome partitioning ATPase